MSGERHELLVFTEPPPELKDAADLLVDGRLVFRPVFGRIGSAMIPVLLGVLLALYGGVGLGVVVAAAGLIRSLRIGIVADQVGVSVRNFFGGSSFGWSELAEVVSETDVDEDDLEVCFLVFADRAGRQHEAAVTRDSRLSLKRRRALVRALGALAAPHRVPFAICREYLGVPPEATAAWPAG